MFKTHKLIRAFYPELTWKVNAKDKIIFLTFDDGPAPSITDYVLEELRHFKARATFFCVGDNIRKHPETFKHILKNGHRVGNHTYNHLNGWKTINSTYLQNVAACQAVIDARKNLPGKKLFRPPHGRIRKKQVKALFKDYHIIMWDVLSKDFHPSLNAEKCLRESVKATESGSIIVFHDSYKSEKKLKYILPRYLDHFSSMGYRFDTL